VPHDKLFAEQARQLADSDLPTDNVTVLDRIYHHGKRVHRTVIFDDLDHVVTNRGGVSDRVRCRMDIFNSVDLSWAFQVFSGAYRDLCRNTLVFGGEKSYHQRKVHRGTLSPEAMIAKATNGLEMWPELGETMWAAYNALTHYATHLPMTQERNANREMTQTKRNNDVRAVLASPSWQYLEGVAA
jgi:hypothetical protein